MKAINDEGMLFYGKAEPLPVPTPLRAGPLSMVLEEGGLRHIRLGSQLVLLRVYWAVRNSDWGTPAMQISDLNIDARRDAFEIRYSARCVSDKHGIDFRAAVRIAGQPDGSLSFVMNGKAHSDFKRNRIGFCVLHPAQQAGSLCEIEHVAGTRETARLPKYIAGMQPLVPFEEMRGLRVPLNAGALANMHFEGDTFEMEDQRNWTDASFKTFCTPLRLPFPVEVKAGESIRQSIAMKIENAPAAKRTTTKIEAVTFTVGNKSVPRPQIGLGQAYAGKPLNKKQIARLKVLNLHHLRVDLDLSSRDMLRDLRRAAKDADALGISLECALFVDPESAYAQLALLRKHLEVLNPNVSHWLVYPHEEKQNAAPAIEMIVAVTRKALGSYNKKAIFAAGTDADFIFANKQPVAYRGMDAFCTCTNPQVHAFDNSSLVETLAAQGALVKSATRLAKGMPVFITPVTLKPRWNPYSTAGVVKGTPPSDARQPSLFGAIWTMGSVKYLAEAGAASITYFETSAERGVMNGDVFPMWQVLADIGEFAGSEIVIAKSREPLRVDGLVLRKGKRMRVLLANMTDQSHVVSLRGLNAEMKIKMLDASNAMQAMRQPEVWRTEAGEPLNSTQITLAPFAIAKIDVSR